MGESLGHVPTDYDFTLIIVYIFLKENSNLGLKNFALARLYRPTNQVKIGQLHVWKFHMEYILPI